MEHWRKIPGHPNHKISDLGRVQNFKTGRILKPFPDRYGYLRLSIGNEDNVYVHKLVCSAFNGKPKKGQNQINHIDSVRTNNEASNLVWCTGKENIEWGYKYGNIDPSKATAVAMEANKKRVRLKESGQTFNSVKECAEYLGVKPTNVSRCLVGTRKGQALHGYHIESVEKEVFE